MEPIEPFVEASFPAANKRGRRAAGKKNSGRVAFAAALETAGREAELFPLGQSSPPGPSEDLEALLDNVNEVGERLRESASLAVVQDYKRAVRDFLAYVVRKTLAVEQHDSSPSVLKRKRFTLIQVIDQKLERLAAGILLDQRPQLEILRRIDEISGLLVDLLS